MIPPELDGSVPLIGFAGSPGRWQRIWSKGKAAGFLKIKSLMFDESEAMHRLLDTLVDSITLYLIAQVMPGPRADDFR
ncbi:MAG: hypothetical protein Ct9H300mP16_09090 [Pseudomonadota bacterium]|nr:MAG: hypothetical protein Ct9H300mP16_09090 [Pseudomonadota bacterium]